MIIRVADPLEDALSIMDGAKNFIERMDFKDFLPKTEEKLVKNIGRVVTMPNVEVIVAEREGKIVSGLGLSYYKNIWNDESFTAEELFWWASPKAPLTAAIRVLKFAKERAKKLGVNIICFKTLTSSPKSVSRIYKKMGFREIETCYAGVL